MSSFFLKRSFFQNLALLSFPIAFVSYVVLVFWHPTLDFCSVSMGLLWCFYDISMGLLLDFYWISMIFL